ncbi:hypothetical protein, partial [Sphingobacterium sp.]|uniref:hypothetical protein n=1 Tax=Sphingobacterium sp. TaxID=341027 RepID=UPI0028A16691
MIKANIERTNPQIGALVGVIDDVNDAREAIVDSVRDRQIAVPFHISVRQAQNQYDTIKSKLKESAERINAQHAALAETVYGDKSWPQIVGRYLALLKNFNQVPLKNIISKEDFNFAQDDTELERTLVVLKHSHNLYKQSHQVHSIFRPLSDDLFLDQQVGPSRVRIEDFIAYAHKQIPTIEQVITELQVIGKQWADDFLSGIPAIMQQDFKPYLAFCIGDSVKEDELPSTFPQEQRINEIVVGLQSVRIKALQFFKQYDDALQQHYNSYYSSLSHALSTYLGYAESSIAQYGNNLLDNSSAAKFKTSLLSIFSGKHKQIKQTRIELKNRIAQVRSFHVQKNYIEHQYNDHLETTDLSIYLNNIEELRQKAATWKEQYPYTIDSYLANINDHHFHTELSELKAQVAPLLQKLDSIEQMLIADYNIVPTTPVTDINGLIEAVPYLIERVTFQLRHFNHFRDYYAARADAYRNLQNSFDDIESNQLTGNITNGVFLPYTGLQAAQDLCHTIKHTMTMFNERVSDFRSYHEWKSFFLSVDEVQQKLITRISIHLKDHWADAFECWYLYWILTTNEPQELPKSDYQLKQYQQQKQEFNNAQLNSIIALWTEKQADAVGKFKSRGQNINSLFNKKGAKGMRRNSLRTIVNREFELFTDFFPVLLVNPSVCSSILPLQEGIFDVVIFDEASQLRLEDTYAALIRGKAKIVSGDKHQMA